MSDASSISQSAITPDWPAPRNVKGLITTRHGGISKAPYDSLNLGLHVGDEKEAVLENRNLLNKTAGNNLDFQWLTQVHGNGLLSLDNSLVDESTKADALYTQQKNIACGVLTADCLSVLFCDEEGSEIAVAHAGWRGLVSGVLQKTIQRFDAEPASILAYLGPVIGPCHFEVGDEVRQAFLDLEIDEICDQDVILFHEVENDEGEIIAGKWMTDLYAIAKILLATRGVHKVFGEPICTYCEFDNFYSYRREGETGRFASVIWKE